MIRVDKSGVSADFGGEVTGKRPSPLPLMTENDSLSKLKIDYL